MTAAAYINAVLDESAHRRSAASVSLTVVDDCTLACLALVADTSLSGTRVARELAG